MASNIDVKETIEDRNSWFNIKRFKISGQDFEKPVKTLDVKNITRNTYERLAKEAGFAIFEVARTVKNANIVQKLTEQSDDYAIGSFFHRKAWLGSSPNVVNLTFDFNPLDSFSDIDRGLGGFLDLYYEHSKLLVTIPNLRIRNGRQLAPGTSPITVDQYLEFVDAVFDVLNTKNNKPIFVPISLRTSVRDVQTICNHYLKRDYLNFWIDFEGKAINEQQLGRLRYLYRELRTAQQFKNVVCYYTNIKREILSNSKISRSPASDVLAAISGANIIGVNREPQRIPFGNMPKEIVEHKSRILDRETYYYEKTTDTKYSKKDANVTHNAIRLNEEFQSQSDTLMRESTIVNDLEKKDMLKENKKILVGLTDKPPTMDYWL